MSENIACKNHQRHYADLVVVIDERGQPSPGKDEGESRNHRDNGACKADDHEGSGDDPKNNIQH